MRERRKCSWKRVDLIIKEKKWNKKNIIIKVDELNLLVKEKTVE